MNTEDKNIEDILFPNRNTLVKKDGVFHAHIVDMELDPVSCVFIGDGCVHIDTKGYEYLELDVNNLYELIDLINQSTEDV